MRKSIESMTGLHVDKVDLHVVGVSFEKENQEMQLSQKAAAVRNIDEDEEHIVQAPVIVADTSEDEDEEQDAVNETAEAEDEE